ncbi:MAG: hypothetical protein QM504_11955 [Pseudomonadota bacterium]
MSDYLLIHLHDAFKNLQESLADANRVIATGDLPVWLPEPFAEDRKLAADAITECWNQDEKVYPLTGLICVSPEHLDILAKANQHKAKFKKEITKLKNSVSEKKASLHKMIESAGNGRDEDVAEAMQVLRISRLNLLWCYRQILVLPKNLDSVSWTWASSHKSIDPITYEKALALTDKYIEDDDKKDLIKEILKNHQKRKLARVKKVVPHLRANITYLEGDVTKRKMVSTATVIVSQDEKLPRIRWPEKDMRNTRLSRSDIKLNPEPIIKALGIYTYFNE